MSIQGLMQKGTTSCSWLEKAADTLLALPRVLWLDRSIEVKKGENAPEISVGPDRDQYSILGTVGPNLFAYCAYILATPLLVLGLACKKIALLTDPKANDYHNMIELVPEDTELFDKKVALERERDNIINRMGEINDELSDLNIPPDSTELVKNLIQNKRASLETEEESLETKLRTIVDQINDTEAQWQPVHGKVQEAFNKFKSEWIIDK